MLSNPARSNLILISLYDSYLTFHYCYPVFGGQFQGLTRRKPSYIVLCSEEEKEKKPPCKIHYWTILFFNRIAESRIIAQKGFYEVYWFFELRLKIGTIFPKIRPFQDGESGSEGNQKLVLQIFATFVGNTFHFSFWLFDKRVWLSHFNDTCIPKWIPEWQWQSLYSH